MPPETQRRDVTGATRPAFPVLLLSLLLGAATVAGFAPFHLYPIPVFTLAGLLLLWRRCGSTRAAAATGFTFGLGLFLGGASWVYVSLHDYGGMAMPVAGLFTFLFCAYLACYPALVGALVYRLGGAEPLRWLLLFPAAWMLSEWTRGWVFTGFPWLALGYSQVPDGPLAGYAPVLGVYGASLVVALTAGALAWLVTRFLARAALTFPRRLALATFDGGLWLLVAVVMIGAGLTTRNWTTPLPGPPTRVSLLQGNIPQELKWRPERAIETLEIYLRLTRAAETELILLPETALPMFNVNVPPEYLAALAAVGRRNGGDVLVGVPELAGPGRFYNSVISLGSAPSQSYRKHHLVPFGDYFPLRPVLGWVMNLMHIPMSDFSRGDKIQRPMAAAGQRVAVNICYEDVFGEEIIRQLPEATVLANFTNDAWWGRSIASKQHLQIAQMRALETGRYMLRATNTGVSAIIDTRGRVVASAPEFVTTTVTGEMQGFQGSTPYIRLGNSAVLTLAALMIAAALAFRRFASA